MNIGVESRDIIWHGQKLATILREHDGMTREIIKQVPQVLENPIIVLKSKNSDSRIVMFGEIRDENGAPVTAVLELQPTTRGGDLLDMNIVASTYGKDSDPAGFIEGSELLYLDPNKNRTRNWMQGLGLQLPAYATSFGSVGSITYHDGLVKIVGVPYSQYMQNNYSYSLETPSYSALEKENAALREKLTNRRGVRLVRGTSQLLGVEQQLRWKAC